MKADHNARILEQHHRGHVFLTKPTDHIRNVAYLADHDLIECECQGFYGWVPK